MNKRIRTYAVIWAILFALFNVICFVSPNEIAGVSKFGGSFWVGVSPTSHLAAARYSK